MQEMENIVRETIEKLGCAYDSVEVIEGPAHPVVLVTTSDSKALIGTKGETLRALNFLVQKMAEKRGLEARFMVDVNRYQLRRIEELQNQARILAERARVFQHDVEMPPLSAYERMIVHSTLSEDPDLITESSGEGKFRRVVIKWKSGNPQAGA